MRRYHCPSLPFCTGMFVLGDTNTHWVVGTFPPASTGSSPYVDVIASQVRVARPRGVVDVLSIHKGVSSHGDITSPHVESKYNVCIWRTPEAYSSCVVFPYLG